MSNIYQEIWDLDLKQNGIQAFAQGETLSEAQKAKGYVVVDEQIAGDKDHKLLPEVSIPKSKRTTYDLAEKLFNNYVLDQTKPETSGADEEEEVQEFIETIIKTDAMLRAREYVSERVGRAISENQWWRQLETIWFEPFDSGKNRDLSGFEHVIVGEQKQGKVQGYHFWYKYYLDENFLFDDEEMDLIDALALQGTPENTPESVTLSFVWRAFDYQKKTARKLTKPIGGFWVGPSIEGLMALGTVRFIAEAMAPKEAEINGHLYRLEMFRSPDDRSMRTFYPRYIKPVA